MPDFRKRIQTFLRRWFSPEEQRDSNALLSPITKAKLEKIVSLPIHNQSLYATALTHRSAIDFLEKDKFISNERLEFLGDAVLDLVIAEHLYKLYPDFHEGALTKLRSQLVNARILAFHANRFELGKLLIVSESAEQNGVRESETALADAFEALIGAVYLDCGYEQVRSFLGNHLLSQTDFAVLIDSDHNYKSALLEYAQGQRLPLPYYFVVEEEGPSHKKIFTVAVRLGEEVLGQGTGKSKKIAEQLAAKEAVSKIKLFRARANEPHSIEESVIEKLPMREIQR